MASVEERLRELRIELPEPPRAIAMYRPALQTGPWVLVSGQLAMRDGAIVHPGRVGEDVTVEAGREAAQVATLNALAAVRALRGDLEGLRVVRLVGYVAATPQVERHPAVIDGASELLRDVFGEEAGVGTRLALGVASLPLRSPVELELTLEVVAEAGAG
jgi:enamine deaminase RidA (YjgF/YER057c/UK114 family)